VPDSVQEARFLDASPFPSRPRAGAVTWNSEMQFPIFELVFL